MKLQQFIINHTARDSCKCGKCIDVGPDVTLSGHTADLYFFNVSAINDPDIHEFNRLVQEDSELRDFEEFGYIALGGILGSQELALRFMGLGELLGLWQVLSPNNMLPGINKALKDQLAGAGYITIKKNIK